MPCWLCENHGHPEALKMQDFIVQRAHAVAPEAMSSSIVKHLTEVLEVTEDYTPITEGEVLLHLQRHMLHPQVRVAHMLRNLVDLSENIREVVSTRSEEDTPLVDVRAAALYLKSVSEVLQLYRTADTSKLLFGTIS